MKKCDWNICRSAAVVAVLALSFAVRGGELLNCGKAKPENVILHTPEKRGQSVRIESLEQRDALRIDWDCARSGYFEFQLKPGVKLPEFRTAQIRVARLYPGGRQVAELQSAHYRPGGGDVPVHPAACGGRQGMAGVCLSDRRRETEGRQLGKESEPADRFSGEIDRFRLGFQFPRGKRIPRYRRS